MKNIFFDKLSKMFEFEQQDRLAGLPNLRHGSINIHPIELIADDEADEANKLDYNILAATFGTAYADIMKQQYDIIKRSQSAYTNSKRPSNISLDILTGDIDDIDFPDMFAPDGQRDDVDIDVSEILEKHFMK